MKFLIALLLTCSSVLGQGFGSFTYDQPFLAGGGNPYNPLTLNPSYWWVATDNAQNSSVSSWKDRVAGLYLVQTNQYKVPTNSSFGVCFAGSQVLSMSNALSFPRGSSIMIIGYSTPMPHPSQFLFDTNLVSGFYVSANGEWNSQYGSVDHVMSSGNIDFSALNDYFCTTAADGSNMRLVAYTNGVLSTSNYFAQNNDATLHSVGGNENYNNVVNVAGNIVDEYLYGYLHEIIIWTNHVLTASEVSYLHNYKVAQYKYLGSITPFFNPASYAGLGAWLRADGVIGSASGGGPKTNNAYVAYWGNSLNVGTATRYFTDSAAGTGPQWNPDTGPNGLPALNWGANNIAAASKSLASNATLTNSMAQPNTYFFVLKQTNSASNQDFMDTTFGGNAQQHYLAANQANFSWYAGTAQTTIAPYVTNWTLLTTRYNGASSWWRTNGVAGAVVPATVGTFANPVPTIGDHGGGGLVFKGFIAEIIMYNAALATNDVKAVELGLMNKYDPHTNIWTR